MNISLPIPDDLIVRLGANEAVSRRALEAFGIQEYLAGRLTLIEFRRILSLETQAEYEGFIAVHGLDDQLPRGSTDAAELLERFRAFRDTHTLDGLSATALIRDGRR